MELLFVTPEEISKTTILGGNVDPDNYTFTVLNVQLGIIEPLLGTLLYDKIKAELIAGTLTGLYEELYVEFVKPITKFEATAEYIEMASITSGNGGLFKHVADNAELPTEGEIYALSNKYHGTGQRFVARFNKWICNNHIPEYQTCQAEVNATKNIKLTAGWRL